MKNKVIYTEEDFLRAYHAWVATSPVHTISIEKGIFIEQERGYPETQELMKKRILAWDHYCDIRDGLLSGTSRVRRLNIESRPSLH